VASIAGHDYFFGSFSVNDTRETLLGLVVDGCFLVRFSRQSGFYTLSAVKNSIVYHWRISTEKSRNRIKFVFENQTYESLVQLISYYQQHDLPIGGAQMEGFKLTTPTNRNTSFQYTTGWSGATS